MTNCNLEFVHCYCAHQAVGMDYSCDFIRLIKSLVSIHGSVYLIIASSVYPTRVVSICHSKQNSIYTYNPGDTHLSSSTHTYIYTHQARPNPCGKSKIFKGSHFFLISFSRSKASP